MAVTMGKLATSSSLVLRPYPHNLLISFFNDLRYHIKYAQHESLSYMVIPMQDDADWWHTTMVHMRLIEAKP